MSEPKPIEMLMEAADIAAEEATRSEAPSDTSVSPNISQPIVIGATPEIVAVLPLRGVIVYPLSAIPLRVSQARSIKLIDDAVANKTPIGLVASKNPEKEDPAIEDMYEVGTLATIVRHFKAPDGVVNLIVQGGERLRVVNYTSTEPYFTAQIEMLPEVFETTMEIEALRRNISQGFNTMAELLPNLPDELANMIQGIEDPRQLMYAVATYMRMELADAQKLLEMEGLPNKMLFLLQLLNKELEVLELGKKIQTQAQSEMEKVQREYFLREQIKAIQRELGESDEQQIEITNFREKIAKSGMNEEAQKEAERELDRLAKLPTQAAEYGVIRTYLDWMTSLPWQKTTSDDLDINHARDVLNQDHYALTDIKDRILEFCGAQRKFDLSAERQSAESLVLSPESAAQTTKDSALSTKDYVRPEREGSSCASLGRRAWARPRWGPALRGPWGANLFA
ncbi:MAG: hypothetical protein HC853_11665 [Anaerolineae bacterium]|nr:hypothetical protein [Anaerolineae bacterium]